jgi:hypothetical protein
MHYTNKKIASEAARVSQRIKTSKIKKPKRSKLEKQWDIEIPISMSKYYIRIF